VKEIYIYRPGQDFADPENGEWLVFGGGRDLCYFDGVGGDIKLQNVSPTVRRPANRRPGSAYDQRLFSYPSALRFWNPCHLTKG